MHRSPVLWQFHKVHHASEAMTPLAQFRHHPLEDVLGYTILPMLAGLATGIFSYTTGGAIDSVTIPGLFLLKTLFALAQVLHHSQIWLSFG